MLPATFATLDAIRCISHGADCGGLVATRAPLVHGGYAVTRCISHHDKQRVLLTSDAEWCRTVVQAKNQFPC